MVRTVLNRLASETAKCLVAAILCAAPAVAFPVERCVNLGNALDSPVEEGEWGYRIETAHLKAIKGAGFDTIRLPVRFSSRWDGVRIDPAFQARVDDVIRTALDLNLNVILDLHHFRDLTSDPATHADSFVALWGALADHYAGWPEALMFELLNEPNGALTTDIVRDLYARVLSDIREDHLARWVIVGGSNWSTIEEMQALGRFDARTVPTFHYYEPWNFTHQLASWITNPPPSTKWGSPEDRARIVADMGIAASHDGPILLGEFGVNTAVPDPARWDWTRTVRTAAEAEGIPWCIWNLASTFRIYDEAAGRWREGALSALFD